MKKKLLYFLIPSVLVTIFIVFTILVKTVDVRYIQEIGNLGFYGINTKVASFVQGFNNKLYQVLTDVIAYLSFASVLFFGGLGLYELIKRKNITKVDPILFFLLAGYILMVFVYFIFEIVKVNFSPLSTPEELKPSYPSSHVFIFMTLIGLGFIALRRYRPSKAINIISYVEFPLLTLLMALLRLLSGKHYLTDIVGAVLLGLAFVSIFFILDKVLFDEKYPSVVKEEKTDK